MNKLELNLVSVMQTAKKKLMAVACVGLSKSLNLTDYMEITPEYFLDLRISKKELLSNNACLLLTRRL